jgi:hypothetical protein
MRVTVLFAIALTIAFATAARGTAADTSNLITTPTGGVGPGASPSAPHTNPIGGEPGSPTFDPLAQTLGSSSTAMLEVELQLLMADLVTMPPVARRL